MKAIGIILGSGMLATAAGAQTVRWEIIGSSKNTNIYVDSRSVRAVEYPNPLPGHIGGTRRATYTEVWIKGEDAAGKPAGKYLWMFDCNGRAAEMAAVTSKGSQDLTARSQQVGVEPYMIRIPPESLYSTVEKRVCKK